VATAAVLALLWMSMVAPAIYRAGALSAQQAPPSGTKPVDPAKPAPPAPLRAQPGIQLAVPAPISPSSVVTSGGPAPFMVGAPGLPGGFRFSFKIDPKTPLADLLPVPPKSQARLRLIDDPMQAPELAFQEPLADVKNAMHHTAHQIAKINHLNRKKTDAFMHALLEKRAHLAGVSFAIGEYCRTEGARSGDVCNRVRRASHRLRNTS